MRVFVAIFDVESSTGGGQTIYREIFRRYPRIDFTYLLDREPTDFPRPPNVHGLKLGNWYVRNSEQTSLLMQCFCWAKTIARTLRGHSFDIVEVPDFMSDFCLLPAALQQAGSSTAIAVALHGQSSKTTEFEWPPIGRIDQERIRVEHLLFGSSDARYGISQSYLDEWSAVSRLPTQFVNPLAWLSFSRIATLPDPATRPPDLYFIGRTERRKGPDLFLESIWRLPRESIRESSIIGPPVPITSELDSNQYLKAMVEARQLSTTVVGGRSPFEIQRLFAARSTICIPSRYDTLNLVALEALMAGCPAIIGSGAGVCRFLDDHLPNVPYTQFDVNDIDAATGRIHELLSQYDEVKEQLAVAIRNLPFDFPLPELEAIYSNRQHDEDVREQSLRIYEDFERLESTTTPTLVRRAKQWVGRSRIASKLFLSIYDRWSVSEVPPLAKSPVWSALGGWKDFQKARSAAVTDASEKIAAMQRTTQLFGRRQLWSELAMAYGLRSDQPAGGHNDSIRRSLVGAAYALRSLRLTDHDTNGLLSHTIKALEAAGFPQEAQLAEMMYGDHSEMDRIARIRDWLDGIQNKLSQIPEFPFDVVEDRRASIEPRISILVACHSKQAEHPAWWKQFGRQTLIAGRQAEIILIDYNSGDYIESPALRGATRFEGSDWPLIWLQLKGPATLGQAWNQGLRFARAPYVTLQAPDEFLRPDALGLMVSELDSRSDIDWIQPSTIDIECNAAGDPLRDQAFYDRSQFDPAMISLDMHAISRTASVYRRSIHERCGYFDPSLRSTSDLEFVQRSVPFVRFATLPATLATVRFFPGAGQSTVEHEIELLRAWDLFRTSAGIERRSDLRSDQLAQTIQLAWSYRPVRQTLSGPKSCSDVDYALRLIALNKENSSTIPELCRSQLIRLSSLFRRLDEGAWNGPAGAGAAVWKTWREIGRVREALTQSLGEPTSQPYFHDERFLRDQDWVDPTAR